MSTTVERHGTGYRYKKGCRCDECKAAAAAGRRRDKATKRANSIQAATFQFAFSCPNCGGYCEHINGSQPRDDLNQRSTAFVKCTKQGCCKDWLLILVVQPAHQEQ